MTAFPALPSNFEPTRATLHAYANAVATLPRVHAVPHPKWWHISLKVRPDGLTTEAMPFADGGAVVVRMDLRNHEIIIESSRGDRRSLPMDQGLTATEIGDALIEAAAEMGFTGEYDREKFENDDPRVYDGNHAAELFEVFVSVDSAMAVHRNRIGGEVGPIQLWPHGFDLAFEWFGTKMVSHEEAGEVSELPAQINLGFYPAGDAYFYSNPWPFDGDALLRVELPEGARWNTDGWEGSMVEYADLAGRSDGVERCIEYAGTVFDAASPLLTR
ncbi:MAG: DUF5996 family protein [Actinomycetota bacterium]|nr:DUF5996 family protein [Actinomycetota bacterium]